jgi:hypothetical protein
MTLNVSFPSTDPLIFGPPRKQLDFFSRSVDGGGEINEVQCGKLYDMVQKKKPVADVDVGYSLALIDVTLDIYNEIGLGRDVTRVGFPSDDPEGIC